ncbi:hypothetical protein PUN28_008323 [Cardiocondyla obscurior]|uniref:Uncharacterized protein n=1 Tax=Cardiocondyla obscurior TaxID=286306 RepID=A0AAW2FX01_9HYME
MTIPEKDVVSHFCLKGYNKYYTDSATLYFYPMTNDESIIKKSLIQCKDSYTTILNKKNLTGKKMDNGKEKNAIERIADAFCDIKNNNNDIVLPPPPQPDDVESFLNLLGSRIRKLTEKEKQEAFQQHLQLSYEMLRNNRHN